MTIATKAGQEPHQEHTAKNPKKARGTNENGVSHWFERFARAAAHMAGKPAAFFGAVIIVVVWLVTGPVFGFSDTWQLVINTGTTIITFLMVFLLQHSQNRDTMALQVKLAELIIAVEKAHNTVATAEDLSEEELERLHRHYTQRARETLDRLEERRSNVARRPRARSSA